MYGRAPIASAPIGALGTGYVTGDPFRLAWRDRLTVWVAALGITWPIKDLVNAGDNPDPSTAFLALDFPGAAMEEQYTFGAPGSNWWVEEGQVTLYLKTSLGAGTTVRNTAELYASQIRKLARNDRFALQGGATVQITGTASMGAGQDEGGMWVEALGFAYRVFNVG